MNAPAFQRYPLTMRHPHERAAIISNDLMNGEGPAARTVHAPPGQPLRFPPVTVRTKEDEDYHAAQGYIAVGGGGDPAAYARATIAPVPPGYVHEEYPRIIDGQLDLGPDAPKPPDNFYPYWVRMDGHEPTLVQDAEEHAALLEKRGALSEPSDDGGVREVSSTDLSSLAEAALLYAVKEGKEPWLARQIPDTEARRHATAVQRRRAIALAFTETDDADLVAGIFNTTPDEVRQIGKKLHSAADDIAAGEAHTEEADATVEAMILDIPRMETDGSPGVADIELLRLEAEQMGIKVDRRWGERRLREIIKDFEDSGGAEIP